MNKSILMDHSEESPKEDLDAVILDGDVVIGASGEEIIINEADESQRKMFESNVERYKTTLSRSVREKSMITKELHSKILDALRTGKGGKKAGVDVKFYAWCKTHFRIVRNAELDILCSIKQDNRIAVVEDYFQVRPTGVDVVLIA